MTRGGNRRCKICLEMSLEDRADIDKRLIDGEKYRTITEDYPEISRYTLQYHRTHMGNPQSEADVMAIRLSREQALARMNAYNPVEFINLLRERLEGVISESQTIVEEFAADVLAGERPIEDLNTALAVTAKLSAQIQTYGGIRNVIDINTAMNKVLSEGYSIVDKK